MERSTTTILRKITFVLLTALVAAVFSGCDGDQGPPGAAGISTNTTTVSYATSLAIKIDSVSINSAPVVNFSVSNQDGTALTGLTTSDLRFTIAKLIPGSYGEPSVWQNYINQESDGGMRASQERTPSRGTVYPLGELVDNKDGSYTYTFETDLDKAAANCPAPCKDADGNPLDVSYNPALTHRVVIQLSHSSADLPPMNAVYTFRPSDGVTNPANLFTREIVKTENCNECHNQLSIHGSRVEVQYCVMCHNPGTWDGGNGNTADFKVMIHKIHMGEDLPSVDGGGSYEIGGHDYSDVVFPQDIRNCTKCHDGSDPDNNPRATSEGNNWETQVSMEACGSCHDNIKFDVAGPPIPGATDPDGHPGGVMSDNSLCTICHSSSGPEAVGSIADSHTIPGKAEAANYQFNIVDVRDGGTANMAIDISVTNPATGVPYDIATGDYTLCPGPTCDNTVFRGDEASLSLQVAWSTFDMGANGENVDYNNVASPAPTGLGPYTHTSDTSTPEGAPTPAQPIRVRIIENCVFDLGFGDPLDTDPDTDWVCSESAGIYTLTKQSALPAGAIGTGRVGFEGHPALPDDSDNMIVKSVVKDFVITGTLTPRREVVDINKCNQCHGQLSLHGGNRVDEPGLCVTCHNPSLTDISYDSNFGSSSPFSGTKARPKVLEGGTNYILYATESPLDGKTEESADFKRLIHGIHAAAKTTLEDENVEAYGFREKGIQVRRDDFSGTRFPGILQDCETCHLEGTYVLEGSWSSPTYYNIQSTTIKTTPAADNTNTDPDVYADALLAQDDDLRISPTAAACSACHDSPVAQAHMKDLGSAVFDETQGNIISNTIETCSVCHGPGDIADVEAVHARR